MKREKIVAIIGLFLLLFIGIVIIINVIISNPLNYLTPYEFWVGIVCIVFSVVFLSKELQKRKRD